MSVESDDVFGIVGSILAGAFEVEAVVAEGGFGVVYRAHHQGFRARVALKCLKIPERLGPQQQRRFLEQFRAEAELMFRLSASIPNVVRPLHVDAFVSNEGRFVPFIALEWLDGKTLDAIALERRPSLTIEELVELLTPVARALERAHDFFGPEGRESIVHRDLKPENIFVAQVAGEQVVKILDFGIAKAKRAASQAAGRVSDGAGDVASFTPAYGAPEQWLPKRFGQTGPWTDVWGLALSMVEVLVGHPIIEGDRGAMMGIVLDESRRPTPRAEGMTVSDAVEDVFARALALEPKRRYADMRAFWDDLQRAIGRQPSARMLAANELPPAPRSQASSAPVLSDIPDLELSPVGVSRKPESASGAERTSVPEIDLEYDLPAAAIALELDPDELADARRSPARRSSPSLPRASAPPLVVPGLQSGAPAPALVSSHPPLHDGPPRSVASSRPPSSNPGSSGGSLELAAAPRSVAPIASSPAPIASQAAVAVQMVASRAPTPLVKPVAPPALGQKIPVPSTLKQWVLGAMEDGSLFRRFWPAAALLGSSVLVTAADGFYASESGQVFSLGPIRAVWFAGVLMLAGIAALVYRLFPPP